MLVFWLWRNKLIVSSEPTGVSVICIMYNFDANSFSYIAASKAGSPAPTTATVLFLKKGPSQTAQ